MAILNTFRSLIVSGGTLLALVLFSCNWSPSPPPQLEGEWQFRYDPKGVGMAEEWYQSTADWEIKLTVPGFWPDPAYDGYGWFKTDFNVNKSSRNKRLALVFESVDDNAEVWLNGVHLGSHRGYGEQFWFDITENIQFGIKNVLVIRIEDTGGPGGINGGIRMDWFGEEKEIIASPFSKLKAVTAPDWVRKAILYEIFVRDFSEAGDFKGVIDKLDELKELGVDCIWLMPVHPIGKVKRKGQWGSPYSVVDYYAVTPDFGTLKDFRRLVEETHKRDIRIILDMVLNHSAWDSPLITDHPEWYTHNSEGEVVSPNEAWTDVADFNYESQELRNYMIEMLLYWAQEFEVDGFRFDVAELLPMDFWHEVRSALKAVKPDILLLAEGDDPELHVRDFDLSYSWNIWHHVIEVCKGRKSAAELARTLTSETYRYPVNSLRMRFVENHDKQRAAREIPAKALRLAHAFIYTIPGVPLLYNGEEVALDHRLELFGKDPIRWAEGDKEFRQFMIELGKLKDANPDLSSWEWEFIEQDFPAGLIAWKRGRGTVCFANFSGAAVEFNVSEKQSTDFKIELTISGSARIQSGPNNMVVVLRPWDLIVIRKQFD